MDNNSNPQINFNINLNNTYSQNFFESINDNESQFSNNPLNMARIENSLSHTESTTTVCSQLFSDFEPPVDLFEFSDIDSISEFSSFNKLDKDKITLENFIINEKDKYFLYEKGKLKVKFKFTYFEFPESFDKFVESMTKIVEDNYINNSNNINYSNSFRNFKENFLQSEPEEYVYVYNHKDKEFNLMSN